jgi:hypothetical protein
MRHSFLPRYLDLCTFLVHIRGCEGQADVMSMKFPPNTTQNHVIIHNIRFTTQLQKSPVFLPN